MEPQKYTAKSLRVQKDLQDGSGLPWWCAVSLLESCPTMISRYSLAVFPGNALLLDGLSGEAELLSLRSCQAVRFCGSVASDGCLPVCGCVCVCVCLCGCVSGTCCKKCGLCTGTLFESPHLLVCLCGSAWVTGLRVLFFFFSHGSSIPGDLRAG